MDERTKKWFDVEKSKQVVTEDFLSFLERRATGNADILANPPSVIVNSPSSSTSVIPDISTSLAAFRNSNSWQSLGVEPSLFTRQRFLPQTPPLTPTPPLTIPDPQSMTIDNTNLQYLFNLPHPQPDLLLQNTLLCP
jgi:hypothetical protein